jgi:SAM-dependent methyltransferase
MIKVLDIGCGRNKINGAIGIDKIKHPNVDYQVDVTKDKFPFKKDYFDEAHANHLLEHMESQKELFHLLREVYRVLKNKGIFHVRVPYWRGYYAWSSIGHRRVLPPFIFYQLDPKLHPESSDNYYYLDVRFKVIKIKFNYFIPNGRWSFLNTLINPIINLNLLLYEKFLSLLLPADEMIVELMCIK